MDGLLFKKLQWGLTSEVQRFSIMSLLTETLSFSSCETWTTVCNSQEHSIPFVGRWSLLVLKMDRNVLNAEQSSSDAICPRKCDTRTQKRPLENSAFMLAMYPQQCPCVLLKFQSVTKNPNKTLLQTKHMRNKSSGIFPTVYPKLPQNLKTT